MKEKFNEFYKWVIEQGIEISDKSNSYQCMDLAYAFVFFLNYPKSTIQHLYAYQVFTEPNNDTNKYFNIIPNTPNGIPQAGDLVVFDKNKVNVAGHISIASGTGDTKTFTSLDQNWNTSAKVVLVNHNYDSPKVLGWLRPKVALNPALSGDEERSLNVLREAIKTLKVENNGEFGNLEGLTRTLVGSYPEYIRLKATEASPEPPQPPSPSQNEYYPISPLSKLFISLAKAFDRK